MIKIKNTLGIDYNVNTQDVYKIKQALNKIGFYKTPEYGLTPYPDDKMYQAIKSYQKFKGIKSDGILTPEGETLASLNKDLSNGLPGVNGPFVCPSCGGHHGGVYGDLCQWCILK